MQPCDSIGADARWVLLLQQSSGVIVCGHELNLETPLEEWRPARGSESPHQSSSLACAHLTHTSWQWYLSTIINGRSRSR